MGKNGENDQNSEKVSTNKMTAEMADILNAHRGKRHVIVMQDFPDPDAISSAFAHQ